MLERLKQMRAQARDLAMESINLWSTTSNTDEPLHLAITEDDEEKDEFFPEEIFLKDYIQGVAVGFDQAFVNLSYLTAYLEDKK